MSDERLGQLSDPRVQKRVEQVRRRREQQLRTDLRALLAEPWGRRLAYHLVFELGGLAAPTFDRAVKDGIAAALHAAHSDGQRWVAITLQGLLQEADLQGFFAMWAEAIAAREADLALTQPKESAPEEDRT